MSGAAAPSRSRAFGRGSAMIRYANLSLQPGAAATGGGGYRGSGPVRSGRAYSPTTLPVAS
jgi:hypothetical protein